ncbi:MAG: hypothetical protein RJR37_09215 [Peptococcaceae bacterium MAG4]|nr:hypothetical protein [Peptococcaceae bacterium MAG4]
MYLFVPKIVTAVTSPFFVTERKRSESCFNECHP